MSTIHHDATYLSGASTILNTGSVRSNRTGVPTIGTFGMMQKYDLSHGLPILTTKKMAIKAVISELLWFIEGSGDERRLCEILHGTRDASKTTIWTQNVEADYWEGATFPGDGGRIYGVQWRSWAQYHTVESEPGGLQHCIVDYIDQLQRVIDGIKTDPFGRRHIVSAWNVGELNQMALPPCHMMFQFHVDANANGDPSRLNCMFYQRSNDYFLGCPFNIASYSILLSMVAHVCGLVPGVLTHVSGDAHIYSNHTDLIKQQFNRPPYASPTLNFSGPITSIDDFNMSNIIIQNYTHHEALKGAMAV